jgi:2-polyprenyl-6-methoxyphenol hydroxylase-like FAD-dependent oxidoreductase
MKVIIAGGGIGGLATALALHDAGLDVEVFEQSREIRALGVGINLLPHAVGILSGLGLLDTLAEVAVEAKEYVYANRHGQVILADARGRGAGYAFPQYSIHRGELQMLLARAVRARLGEASVRCGQRLCGLDADGSQAIARFVDADAGRETTVHADVLVACDGIHSAARALMHPGEGMPIWNGVTIWRGTSRGQPYMTGGSIVKAGNTRQKFIVYPISRPDPVSGEVLLNWIADLHTPDRPYLTREDWNRPGRLEDFLPEFEDWRFSWLDVPRTIRAASAVFEFPMVDRDPLPCWSRGRATLLGDAAHPMYPIASNGATQAILDARQLADSLAGFSDPVAALADYESRRLPPTAAIVAMNRAQGPDVLLDIVDERAPGGFVDIEDVLPSAELAGILERYKQAAGHQQNRETPAWSLDRVERR